MRNFWVVYLITLSPQSLKTQALLVIPHEFDVGIRSRARREMYTQSEEFGGQIGGYRICFGKADPLGFFQVLPTWVSLCRIDP